MNCFTLFLRSNKFLKEVQCNFLKLFIASDLSLVTIADFVVRLSEKGEYKEWIIC